MGLKLEIKKINHLEFIRTEQTAEVLDVADTENTEVVQPKHPG